MVSAKKIPEQKMVLANQSDNVTQLDNVCLDATLTIIMEVVMAMELDMGMVFNQMRNDLFSKWLTAAIDRHNGSQVDAK